MTRDDAAGIRVLYVAADVEGRDRVLARLEAEADLLVTTVGTVPAALDRLGADLECVVCAHRRDGPDGVELLRAIRGDRPDLPVVVVDAAGDAGLAGRAIEAGVSQYVPRIEGWEDRLVGRVRAAVEAAPRQGLPEGMPIEARGLREQLRLKERAMDEAPVGITISDPDRPDNPLIYLNAAFERLTGYEPAETAGRNCRFLQGPGTDPGAVAAMREAIAEARPVSVELVNYRKDGERFWNEVDIAPVRDEAGEVTHYVGFQTDVTARKEAELAVERERENLAHLVARVNGLVGDVTRELAGANSRAAIEAAVCERIAETDIYPFAWIGAPDLGRDRLLPAARAGDWDPDPEALETPIGGPSDGIDPVARAYAERTVQVVAEADRIEALAEGAPWLEGVDVAGVAAVPLVYGETVYGVLVVYTDEPGALDERETVVLEALGRATGTAINAVERGRLLAADEVVELEFELRDRDLFFVDLSERAGCRLEYRGAVYRGDGSLLLFFDTDADPETIEAAAAAAPGIESAAVISEGEAASVVEFVAAGPSVVSAIAERGARTRSITAEDGVGRLRVELPSEADARTIVELVQDRYPGTELLAHRRRERPPTSRAAFIADLEDRLTARQREALRKAYVSGYYEWNRPVTGDTLAESMGVSRSTFHQHLRAAERKLVEAFVEGGMGD